MTTVAFIFARGGSKGVPRKNLRLVGGIPLLGHAINHARAATLVERVYVSTEDAEIAETARLFGAGVIDRPAELATDDAPEWACWQHAVRSLGMGAGDVFVTVPCTAPLRLPGDVDAVIQRLQSGDYDAVITLTPCHRNPYYNQFVMNSLKGTVSKAAGTMLDNYTRRQDAPVVYDATTVAYAAWPDYILRSWRMEDFDTRIGAVVVPPERAIDIDSELDLRIAEILYGEREAGPFVNYRDARQQFSKAVLDAVSDIDARAGGKGKVVIGE